MKLSHVRCAAARARVVGLLVGSLADFWNQELVPRWSRSCTWPSASRWSPTGTGIRPRAGARGAAEDHRVDSLIVLPIGPASGEWSRSRARSRPSRSATPCPGSPRSARSCSPTTGGSRRRCATWARSATRRRSAVVGGRDVARAARRARGHQRGGHARARLPDRALRLLAERLAAARARAAVGPRPADRDAVPFRSIAYGVYLACAELGLEIPADVSVAGFGEPDLAPARPAAHVDDLGRGAVAQVATGFLQAPSTTSSPTNRAGSCSRHGS